MNLPRSFLRQCALQARKLCVHHTGEPAYLETLTCGMVPCTITGLDTTDAWVTITTTRPGYPQGLTDIVPQRLVVPRGHVRRANLSQGEYHTRVLDGWRWTQRHDPPGIQMA